MRKIVLLTVLLGFAVRALTGESGIRLAWDYNTGKQVDYGVYSRVHRLGDGSYALVYSDGPDVWIRKSSDNCKTWSNRTLVSHNDGYNNTNAELLSLANGWLIYAWNGRPLTEKTVPYVIKIKISKDKGASWIDEQTIYTADNTFENGCWEPAMLQLPSGEIQLFFANENPYRSNFDQEISMYRSFDNGYTWTNYTTTSYRAGFRDGMPVPLRLQNNKGLVYCIEDNGFNGTFKPVIIYSSEADNWKQGTALWNSPRRWGALRADNALPSGMYAGAPFITQLPTGETLLSTQSMEARSNDNSMVRVYIGNNEAHDFCKKSTPFPWLNATGTALWNALEPLSADKVLLTSSVNPADAAKKGGIWTIEARVVHEETIGYAHPTIDGVVTTGEWTDKENIFIGTASDSYAKVKTAWDENNLYLLFDVSDKQLWADGGLAWDDDGVEVYLDPHNSSCNGVCAGMYKLLFNIGGGVLFDKGNTSGAWETWTPTGLSYKTGIDGTLGNNADTDKGFRTEVAIPWAAIGGQPELYSALGLHIKLHDDDNGAAAEYHDELSGNDANRASTYLVARLHDKGTGLYAQYFNDKTLTDCQLTRIDQQVQFNWGNGSPSAAIVTDGFSARWQGQIKAPVSGTYTFSITSDNGRRLWIDNTLIIDKWLDDWDVEYTGTIALEKGKSYPIRIEYFENQGGANILFQWSAAGLEKQAVPQSALFPVLTQIIDLQKGWNLISTNLSPTDSSIATIFKGLDIQEIKNMNSFWRKGQTDAFNSLQKLTVGEGYLVNMNTAGTLTVSGTPVSFSNPQINQFSNWHLIGCPYQTATPLSTNFNTTNCSVIKNFEGFWMPNGSSNSILNLEPGRGYFIKK